MILSLLYPRWYMACVVTLMLDILSHWMHMYASLLTGSETHKVRTQESLPMKYASKKHWLLVCTYRHIA